MALTTHQLKGSNIAYPSITSPWSRGSELKHPVQTFHRSGGKDESISLKSRLCWRSGASLILVPKSKLFKILAFKGSSGDNNSGGRANGSETMKNAVKVSYLQKKSEESFGKSSEVQNGAPAPYTAADETTTRSLVIQDLRKHWLMLLRMPSETRPVEAVLEEPSSTETLEMPIAVQDQKTNETLKRVLCFLMGLDATIKTPLFLVPPVYLAVNLVYGLKISKELTPLWIIGPLVVALYVKTCQAVIEHCAFRCKQAVQVLKILPGHYMLAHDYLASGKLKETMITHMLNPVVAIKNTDYNELTRRKMENLQLTHEERRLEFVESIWPHYCRTRRALKRANVI